MRRNGWKPIRISVSSASLLLRGGSSHVYVDPNGDYKQVMEEVAQVINVRKYFREELMHQHQSLQYKLYPNASKLMEWNRYSKPSKWIMPSNPQLIQLAELGVDFTIRPLAPLKTDADYTLPFKGVKNGYSIEEEDYFRPIEFTEPQIITGSLQVWEITKWIKLTIMEEHETTLVATNDEAGDAKKGPSQPPQGPQVPARADKSITLKPIVPSILIEKERKQRKKNKKKAAGVYYPYVTIPLGADKREDDWYPFIQQELASVVQKAIEAKEEEEQDDDDDEKQGNKKRMTSGSYTIKLWLIPFGCADHDFKSYQPILEGDTHPMLNALAQNRYDTANDMDSWYFQGKYRLAATIRQRQL